MTLRGTSANLMRIGVTTTIVAALTFAPLAYGAGPDSTTTPSIGSPDTSPKASSTPVPPPVSIGPGAPGAIGSERSRPEPSVIGDAGVDKATKEFRARLAAQQARLDAFIAQLDALDRELSIASESYNDASDKLEAMKDRVQNTQGELVSADEAYDRVTVILGDQLGTMYRSGTYSPVEMLLDSKSLNDFISRLKFLNTVGTDSAQVLEEYAKTKADLQDQLFRLRNAKRMAESLEFELKARKIEVQLRIVERQELFAKTQSDLLVVLSQQATYRRAEEAALLKEILAGASKAGIIVQPGSPVETVLAYHGVPYLWGGATPSGFDCSGLLLYVMRQHGVDLPHYSGSQFLLGQKILPTELEPGDAVFFGSPIHHVGMYIGGGYFIHAPRTGDYVKISKLADRSDYAGARRYAWQPRFDAITTAVSSSDSALNSVR